MIPVFDGMCSAAKLWIKISEFECLIIRKLHYLRRIQRRGRVGKVLGVGWGEF